MFTTEIVKLEQNFAERVNTSIASELEHSSQPWARLLVQIEKGASRRLVSRLGELRKNISKIIGPRALVHLAEMEFEAWDDVSRRQDFPIAKLVSSVIINMQQYADYKERLVNEIVEYLRGDDVLYLSNENGLRDLKLAQYDPIIEWLEQHHGIETEYQYFIAVDDRNDAGASKLRDILAQRDAFSVTVIWKLAKLFRSSILSLALVDNFIDGRQAFEFSQTDSRWARRSFLDTSGSDDQIEAETREELLLIEALSTASNALNDQDHNAAGRLQ